MAQPHLCKALRGDIKMQETRVDLSECSSTNVGKDEDAKSGILYWLKSTRLTALRNEKVQLDVTRTLIKSNNVLTQL